MERNEVRNGFYQGRQKGYLHHEKGYHHLDPQKGEEEREKVDDLSDRGNPYCAGCRLLSVSRASSLDKRWVAYPGARSCSCKISLQPEARTSGTSSTTAE